VVLLPFRWKFEIIRVEEENLIKVSVLYPNAAGSNFDMNYYLNRHMPMVQRKLGCLQTHSG
jgi:hypothetical protein